jgi:hypothetical protein
MEHQFFIRQQNLKLYRSRVAASEAAAAKADVWQKKQLKLLAKEVTNRRPERTNAFAVGIRREIRESADVERCGGREIQFRRTRRRRTGTASVSPCTTPRQGLLHLGRAPP